MLENNTTFWYIFNFLDLFIYFVFFKLLIEYSNKRTTSNKINYISLILLAIISFFIGYKNILIYMIFFIIYYKINYNKNILKVILYSGGYWIVLYRVIEYISLELVCMANYLNIYGKAEVTDPTIALIETFVFKAILSIVLYLIYVYINKCYKSKKISGIFIFIPIVTNCLSLLLAFRYKAFNNDSNIELIIMLFMISISNIAFFMTLKIILNTNRVKDENKILIDNILKEYNYYSKIHKEQDKVKEIHHDIKNHMICIRDMCENNDVNNVINYIDNIEVGLKKYKNNDDRSNTGNMVLDSILKNKKLLCQEKLIDFDIDMDFSKNDYMDMIDICIIFSNIIDNAIEACDKIKSKHLSKKIRIESKYIEEFCIIVIENTKINKVIQKNNNFITSKKDKYIHGIGIRNVKSVVKKYFGELIIENYENKFILKIMIPYKY